MTSDMMIESPEAAKVGLGGGKPRQVLVDRWKGMSPEQLSAIHRENQVQRVEKQVLESNIQSTESDSLTVTVQIYHVKYQTLVL